jgi:hypothetical protein
MLLHRPHAPKENEGFLRVNVALSFFLFLIKCKNIIDQKGAGVQQYKEKGTKSFDQIKSKASLLNIK